MSFDPQPYLADRYLIVRPLQEEDWQSLFCAAADPLVWEHHPAHDRWQEEVFRRYFEEALACGTTVAAVDRQLGTAIGMSRFDRTSAAPGEVEIGWTFLARAYWGGETNRALKRLMIGHALQSFDRVIFRIGEDNLRSRRAIEKIGAQLTDRTDMAEVGGRTVRHLVYAMDADAFAAGPLSHGRSGPEGEG